MAEKPTYGDLETRVRELEETIAGLRASQEHPQGNARSPAASFCQYEKIFTAFLTLTDDPVTINRVSDGRYVLVNDAFSRLTGYSAEEAIGRTPFDLNLYADLADRDRIVACLGKNDRVDGLEVRFRVKDGSVRNAYPVSGGSLPYFGMQRHQCPEPGSKSTQGKRRKVPQHTRNHGGRLLGDGSRREFYLLQRCNVQDTRLFP
jgi:PAS domain S-box-containing protein